MEYTDPITNRRVAALASDPIGLPPADFDTIARFLDRMILSASGWRGVFAADEDEESQTDEIAATAVQVVAIAALTFCDWIGKSIGRAPEIVIGTDTRPTGPTIMAIMIRALTASGVRVRSVSVASAPEIMAYAKTDGSIDGFIYISASHNPVGHNGIKFGAADGSVLEARASGMVRDDFLDRFSPDRFDETIARLRMLASAPWPDAVTDVYQAVPEQKRRSLAAYARFTDRVVAGPVDDPGAVLVALKKGCGERRFGVVGELNGSARSVSIDRDYLGSLGIATRFENDSPGEIAHRIVPEGESLDPCRTILTSEHAADAAFEIGYVPDNDGDRGNLVYFDHHTGVSQILHAQEVFALACAAELACLAAFDTDDAAMDRTAIVVNGPTSLRIERIAAVFGARVFRAEVGEAHVVARAAELREEGLRVRILGEGSNGGTIIHPSTVRDPLSTIAAIAKLLRLPGPPDRPSPYAMLTERLGGAAGDATVTDALSLLPRFSTTGAYESRAILQVEVPDHGALKRAYEAAFPHEFEARQRFLDDRFGFVSWRGINYEGLEAKPGFGNRDRAGGERGGLAVVFTDHRGEDRGFIWMRGSGTEPVFRVLADLEGDDPEGEALLLEWQKELITKARGASATPRT